MVDHGMSTTLAIASVTTFFLLGLLILFWSLKKRTCKETQALFQHMDNPPHDDPMIFTHQMIEGLDQPAKRYLAHVLSESSTCHQKVELFMDGKVALGDRTLPTKSHVLIANRRGYSLSGFSPPRLHLQEHYLGDKGEKIWTWMQVWPVKKHQGDDTTRSLRHKFALYLIWLPASLLPQSGTIWERVDEDHAVAKLLIDNEPIDITLNIDKDGRLKAAWITRRVSMEKTITYMIEVKEEDKFNTTTIPSKVRLSWKDPSGQGDDKTAMLSVTKVSFG